MSSLGKLGAFGKTNVLDVAGGLFKQYNEGLVQANEMRRQNLLDALKEREAKRAEEKWQIEKNRMAEDDAPIDITDMKGKLGPVWDEVLPPAIASGAVIEKDGRYVTSKRRMRENGQEVLKQLSPNSDRILDAEIKRRDLELSSLQEQIDKETDPVKKSFLEQQKRGKEAERSNLYDQRSKVQEYSAGERARMAVEAKDPMAQAKLKSEEELANQRAASAESSREEARKKRVETARLEDGSYDKDKLIKEGTASAIQKSLIEHVLYFLQPATESGGTELPPWAIDANDKLLPTSVILTKMREYEPEAYALIVQAQTRAEQLYIESSRSGQGQRSFEECASQALREVQEEMAQSVSHGKTPPASTIEVAPPGRNTPPVSDNSVIQGAKPAPKDAQGRARYTPGAATPGKGEPDRSVVPKAPTKQSDGSIDMPDGMRYSPPKGWNDKDTGELMAAAQARKATPEQIASVLLKNGWIPSPLGPDQNP